jgi:hypothetical protein
VGETKGRSIVWAFAEGEGYWSIFCMIVFYRLGGS